MSPSIMAIRANAKTKNTIPVVSRIFSGQLMKPVIRSRRGRSCACRAACGGAVPATPGRRSAARPSRFRPDR